MAAATGVTKQKGGGVFFTGYFTLDSASLNAGAQIEHTVAIPEVKVGDVCVVNRRGTPTAGETYIGAYCAAAGTMTVVQVNLTANPIDAASGTYDFVVIRGRNAPAHTG